MTHKQWVCSDHHFGHKNILTFVDNSGYRIRPFSSIEEMHDVFIKAHNSVVSDNDTVYFLGDVAINKAGLTSLHSMKGRKILIRGNHDIFKLQDYVPFFEDVRAYKVLPHEAVLSHIPLHPECIERFRINIHGHLHANFINGTKDMASGHRDKRYINVCMEKLPNWTPIELQGIVREWKE